MGDVVLYHGGKNHFKAPSTFIETEIFEGMNVSEFVDSCLSGEQIALFYSIIGDTSDDFEDLSLDQLSELAKYKEDETEVNTLLILNNLVEEKSKGKDEYQAIEKDYITFDEYKIVYSKHSWLHLRRQILGNHTGTPEYFIDECRKYFPNLVLHDNCVLSLVDDNFEYLDYIPRKIIYYLTCLNDRFNEVKEKYSFLGANPNVILRNFSGKFGLDKDGSLQQNPDKKKLIKFEFIKTSDQSSCTVLCEPHLKIEKEDSNYKGNNVDHRIFHPRIYFCYTSPEIDNGKILVGSIGKHI